MLRQAAFQKTLANGDSVKTPEEQITENLQGIRHVNQPAVSIMDSCLFFGRGYNLVFFRFYIKI
jgi:hypothetical protein